jgi:hypothetical protein
VNPIPLSTAVGFLCKIANTRDRESDCECQRYVGELAERRLAGRLLDAKLAQTAHHMTVCDECREEYEALEAVLRVQL